MQEKNTSNAPQFHEALFYEKREDKKVKCRLCPQQCLIDPGDSGFCFIRKNVGGILYAMEYGRVSSAHLDPIEKKPLFNFHPGSTIFSIGGVGCNLRCPWCQNWNIAQPGNSLPGLNVDSVIDEFTEPMSPDRVIELAKAYESSNCIGVAYTYNEPFIWYEFVKDISIKAKEEGMYNVMVTNGYVMPEPLKAILPYIDAMNIDMKGINDSYYRRLKGHVGPVMKTAKTAKKYCHIEITNLVVPGLNDSSEDFRKLVDWVAGSLGRDTPLHFTRYFPNYKWTAPPTNIESLKLAESIAREKLDHVYLGNI